MCPDARPRGGRGATTGQPCVIVSCRCSPWRRRPSKRARGEDAEDDDEEKDDAADEEEAEPVALDYAQAHQLSVAFTLPVEVRV